MEQELIDLLSTINASDEDRNFFLTAINSGKNVEETKREEYFNELKNKILGHKAHVDSSFEAVERLERGEVEADLKMTEQGIVPVMSSENIDLLQYNPGQGFLLTETLPPVELEPVQRDTKYSMFLPGFKNIRDKIDTQYNNNINNNQSSEDAWNNALSDVLGEQYDNNLSFSDLNQFLQTQYPGFDLGELKKGNQSYADFFNAKKGYKGWDQFSNMYERIRDKDNWSLDENNKPQHKDLSKDRVENIVTNREENQADWEIANYINKTAEGWSFTDAEEGLERILTPEEFNTPEFQDYIKSLKERFPNATIDETQILKDIHERNVQLQKGKAIRQSVMDRVGDGFVNSMKTTIGQVIQMPDMLAAIGTTPINLVLDLAGMEEIDYKDLNLGPGYDNVLAALVKHEENRDYNIELWNETHDIGEGVWDELAQGNWSNFASNTIIGLADSAGPTWGILAMGFGGASMKTITAYGTPVFMAGELAEQRAANPEMPLWELTSRAWSSALAETAFSSIGTARIGRSWRVWLGDDAAEATVKVASKTAKNGFIMLTPKQAQWRDNWIRMYKEAWKKYPIFAGAGGEGIEEVMTQVTQNLLWGRPPFEGVGDAFVLGVAGGGVYSSPTSLNNTVKLIEKSKVIWKVNDKIKFHRPGVKEDDPDGENVPNTKNNFLDAFDSESENNTALQLDLTQIDGAGELLDETVDQAVEDGDISKEKGDEIKKNFRDTARTAYSIVNSGIVNKADEIKAADLVSERDRLKQEIEEIDDKALSADKQARVDELNEQITALVEKNIVDKATQAKKITEDIKGAEIKEDLNTTDKVKAYLTGEIDAGNINVELGKVKDKDGTVRDQTIEEYIEEKSNERGFIIQNPKTGDQTVIINAEVSAQEGAMSTDLHEVGHAMLYRTLLKNPKAAEKMAGAALRQLMKIDVDQLADSEYLERLKRYQNEPNAVQAEEALTLLSEAIAKGDIVLNSDMITQIKDFIRQSFQALGWTDIKFNSDQDVINFIKDYNKNFAEGKLNKAQIKMANEGAIVNLTGEGEIEVEGEYLGSAIKTSKADSVIEEDVVIEEDPDQRLINDATVETIQNLPEGDVEKEKLTKRLLEDNAGLFLGEFGIDFDNTFLGKINKNTNKPITRQEVLNEISTRMPGIIGAWTPQTQGGKASFGTYAVSSLKSKLPGLKEDLIGAKEKKGRVELTEDIATEEAKTDFDVKQKDTSRKKKYISSLPAVSQSVTENVAADLIGGVQKTGETTGLAKEIVSALTTSTNPTDVAKNIIASTKGKGIMQVMRKAIGKFGSEAYNSFVDRVVDQGLAGAIPAATIKRRFGKLFGLKKIGKTDTRKVKDDKVTYSRPDVFQINKADKQKLKDYFKAGEKRSQSLFSLITEGIYAESIDMLKNDSNFIDKLGDTLELKDKDFKNKVDSLKEKYKKELNEGETKNFDKEKAKLVEEYLDTIATELDQRTKEDTSLDVIKASKSIKEVRREAEEEVSKEAKAKKKFDKKADGIVKTIFQDSFIADIDKRIQESIEAKEEKAWRDLLKAEGDRLLAEGIEIMNPVTGKPLFKKGEEKVLDMRILSHRQAMQAWVLDEASGYLPQELIETGSTVIGKGKSKIDATGKKIRPRDNVKAFQDTNEVKTLAQNKEVEYGNKLKPLKIGKKTYSVKEQIRLMKVANQRRTITGKTTRGGEEVISRGLNVTFMEWFGSAEHKKEIKEKKLGLKIFALNMRKMVEANPQAGFFLLQMMRGTAKDQGHFIRKAAPIGFMQLDLNELDNITFMTEDYRITYGITEEHTLPATKVAIALTTGILESTEATNEVVKHINDKYMQGPVDKKGKTKDLVATNQPLGTDNILEIAGLADSTPMGWSLDNPNDHPFARMFNPLTAKIGGGINPAKFVLPEINPLSKTGKLHTIESKYKVNSSGLLLDKKSKARLMQAKSNNSKLDKNINRDMSVNEQIDQLGLRDKAARRALKTKKETKGISIFDFDDTVAYSNSKIIVKMPNGTTRKITPAQFAKRAQSLKARGAEFDFREFNTVKGGKPGPLAQKLKKQIDKFGNKDVFILTARPQSSAESIHEFLKGIGIDIPIENITGLEDGSPEAKARWVTDKAAAGYNDFYFVDDAYKNVRAVQKVLDQIDVKGKVQQAIADKAKRLDSEMNALLEETTGVEAFKDYSAARARTQGASIGKFEFFIPPSAEDFTGLLYKMLGKGKVGDRQMAWFKKMLLDPFERAENIILAAKVSASNDFKALKDNFNAVPGNLNKKSGVGPFTYDHALRVYIWTKQGMDIPGMSKQDIIRLNKFVLNNPQLQQFGDQLMVMQKGKPYPAPTQFWTGGNITSDIINDIDTNLRAEALTEWQENVDIIFSEKNLNKLEAIYGTKYRKSLEDSLRRMKSGKNRPASQNWVVNNLLDWLNNSVGAVMFLNTRSALLQLISNVNFINWNDNNPLAAGKVFANQPLYWKKVMELMNSDYLVHRRNGLRINVSESEIEQAARKGGIKGTIALLLSKGFIFTRIADSLAIATGGATFVINRTETYLKEGMSKKDAEAKAFEDFKKISEETQQSSRTDRISMQQASGIGRVVLAFANTPMQYARLMKKAFLDLKNERGDWKSNLSKLVYYSTVQNLMFNALQQAVFALAFGDEEKKDEEKEEAVVNIANGMADSILRGLGWGGAAVSAIKNVMIELARQHGEKSPKYHEAVWEVFDFSPPLDTKVRNMRKALQTFSWNREEMERRGWHIDNPAYLAWAQLFSAGTNIPVDRVMRKIMNMRQAVDANTELWQSIALLLGYTGWQLGLPYWGVDSTIESEEQEDALIKEEVKKQQQDLRDKGYKKITNPEDYSENDIETVRSWTGKDLYFLKPENEREVREEDADTVTETYQRKFDSIKAENKPDQVKTLTRLGLSKKEIRDLRYEKNRIEKILELIEE